MILRTVKYVAFACVLASGASATTITFDRDRECITEEVTITAGPLNNYCVVSEGPVGSNAMVKGGQDASYWLASFDALVDFVSIDLGDFGGDADELFLATINSFNEVTGVVTKTIGAGISGMHTLSLSIANTSAIAFGVTGYEGDGGIYADNLTFNTQVSAVPIPASALLFGTALAGLGALRRRKTS